MQRRDENPHSHSMSTLEAQLARLCLPCCNPTLTSLPSSPSLSSLNQPASLRTMHEFCMDATAWLLSSTENVVAIHCKAGKGRTGVCACALLVYLVGVHSRRVGLDLRAERERETSG